MQSAEREAPVCPVEDRFAGWRMAVGFVTSFDSFRGGAHRTSLFRFFSPVKFSQPRSEKLKPSGLTVRLIRRLTPDK
jgi:hypothetical protein